DGGLQISRAISQVGTQRQVNQLAHGSILATSGKQFKTAVYGTSINRMLIINSDPRASACIRGDEFGVAES
ncbi:MAG TPA: hypothetical protein VFU27_05930, partial [Terriglobales bacterium]|nr:hypothetical protein [Terriglobales bacterium]